MDWICTSIAGISKVGNIRPHNLGMCMVGMTTDPFTLKAGWAEGPGGKDSYPIRTGIQPAR